MITLLGWICTILVVLGYYLNARQNQKIAFLVWIVGDVGWIIYDYFIDNWSHATLSTIIIIINFYGIYKKKYEQKDTGICQ